MTILEFSTQQPLDTNEPTIQRPVPMGGWAELPRRFDIHQVPTVIDALRSLGRHGTEVVVDGSAVEMIDLAALESLSRAIDELALHITNPSVALRATVGFTHHDRIATRFVDATRHASAA